MMCKSKKKLIERLNDLDRKCDVLHIPGDHSLKVFSVFGGFYEKPFATRIYEVEQEVEACKRRMDGIEEHIDMIMDFLGAEFHHEEAKSYVRNKKVENDETN